MRSLEALFLIGVEGVTEIWLVRHADSYQNMVDVNDPPLSSLGIEQAKRLGERVRRIRPAAVYASPYRRALETAHAITHDVRVDGRLVEIALDLGEDGSLHFKEDPIAGAKRMRGVLDDIVRDHQGERVVAVTHGAAIVACLTDVMQLEPGHLRLLPYYTSISTIRILGDRRMVGALGDTAHLEP